MAKPSSKGMGGPSAETDPTRKRPGHKLRLASAAVKSGFKRYPRELIRSMRPASGGVPSGADFIRVWEEAAGGSVAPIVSWLGHCTVLLKIGGLTVLTDPVLSHRIGPRLGKLTMGLNRLQPPPVSPAELPPIDIIALSHPHFDHLDKPTLRALVSERTAVVTARKTRRLIPRGFGHVVELDWDQRCIIRGVEFSALRPAHWGARTAWDRHRGYNSYVISADGQRVFFAGDTAHTEAFAGAGPVDLAIFGIGAYHPWIHAHATPEEVWSMFTAMAGGTLLPVHHSTFRLSEEPHGEPMERLMAAAGEAGSRVIRAAPGRVVVVSRNGG